MDSIRFDRAKLLELQGKALHYHQLLAGNPLAHDIDERGGFLIQGNHYAVSKKMLFGINPAATEKGQFIVNLIDKEGPWDAKEGSPEWQQVYWRNCTRFFGSEYLRHWVKDATSTFASPWMTADSGKPHDLDAVGDADDLTNHALWKGPLGQYSKDIVTTMVSHCQPQTIVAAGKRARELLVEFLNLEETFNYEVSPDEGIERYGMNVYQWGTLVSSGLTVFQVPHFSRCRGTPGETALRDCAIWLELELQRDHPPAARPIDSEMHREAECTSVPHERRSRSTKTDLCSQLVGAKDGNQELVDSKTSMGGCVQLWKSLTTGKYGVVRVLNNRYKTILAVCKSEVEARAMYEHTN